MQRMDYVTMVGLSDDGRRLVTVSANGTVAIVDTATGHILSNRRRWIRNAETYADIDASGTRVLLEGSGDPSPRGWLVWNLARNTLAQAEPNEDIGRVRFSPDGSRVLGLRRRGGLVSFPSDSLDTSRTVDEDARTNWAYAISTEHDRIVALPNNGRSPLQLMTAAGQEIASVPVPEPEADPLHEPGERGTSPDDSDDAAETAPAERSRWIGAVFRPGGGQLVTGTDRGIVDLRHPDTAELLHRIVVAARIRTPMFSGDGERILVPLREESAAMLIDPHTGRQRRIEYEEHRTRWAPTRTGFASNLSTWLSLAPDGTLTEIPELDRIDVFAVARDADVMVSVRQGEVTIRRASDYGLLRTLPRGPTPSSVWRADWLDDEALLVRNRRGGRVWTASGARHVGCASAEAALSGRLASEDAVLSGYANNCDLSTGAETPLPDGEYTVARAGAVALTMSSDRTEWHVRDAAGTLVRTIPASVLRRGRCGAQCLVGGGRPSRDGSTYFFVAGGELFVVDLRRGRLVAHVDHAERRVRDVVPSPDGRYAAVRFFSDGDTHYQLVTSAGRDVDAPTLPGHESIVWVGQHTMVSTAGSTVRVTGLRGTRAQTREYQRGQLEGISNMEGSDDHVLVRTTGGAHALAVAERGDSDTLTLIAEGEASRRGHVVAGGAYYFACVSGRVVRRASAAQGNATDFGPCPSDEGFSPSPDGRIVAMPSGARTLLRREDGARLRLTSSVAADGAATMVAEELQTPRFAVFEEGQPESDDPPRVLFRPAGAMGAETTAMVRVEASGHHDPEVLRRFLVVPAATAD